LGLKHSEPLRGLVSAARSPVFQGRFGRIFRSLPPATFGKNDAENEANLEKLAGAMKGGDDPPKDGPDDEESGIPALYTYLGQFIDHDLTFDPASSLQKQNDPNSLTDFRTPAFDLDCLYGRGPDDQPYMYGDGGTLLVGDELHGGQPGARDLARGPNGRALIGDPRNDENTIVSQLQGLFQRFHNRALAESKASFEEVQQIVRFHYQYVILNDFLPRIIDEHVLNGLKTQYRYDRHKLEFYHFRNDPFLPVEFSAAAYRFGHSMVRPGYRLNDDNLLPIFPDLVGFLKVDAGRGIDWGRFIDIDIRPYNGNDANARKRLQLAYRIDTSIVEPLSRLPKSVASSGPVSLAERNLKRGWRLGLPSGQSVARAMAIPPLRDEQILIGTAVDKPDKPLVPIVEAAGAVFAGNCPLWTYILAEAMHHRKAVEIPVTANEVRQGSLKINTPQLGRVGGRIVAEVFLGLMFGDPASMLTLDPNWQPPAGPDYHLRDFVRYALG
jgi:Animal haem peroxidase